MDQLGPNAVGETLEPGRVTNCYLGLLLPPGPAGEPEAGTVLIVIPAALLHLLVPQPAGSLVYGLLTGHPEREAGALVFVADLTCELRAWPQDSWAKVGVDPDQVAQAVIACWQADAQGHHPDRQQQRGQMDQVNQPVGSFRPGGEHPTGRSRATPGSAPPAASPEPATSGRRTAGSGRHRACRPGRAPATPGVGVAGAPHVLPQRVVEIAGNAAGQQRTTTELHRHQPLLVWREGV